MLLRDMCSMCTCNLESCSCWTQNSHKVFTLCRAATRRGSWAEGHRGGSDQADLGPKRSAGPPPPPPEWSGAAQLLAAVHQLGLVAQGAAQPARSGTARGTGAKAVAWLGRGAPDAPLWDMVVALLHELEEDSTRKLQRAPSLVADMAEAVAPQCWRGQAAADGAMSPEDQLVASGPR
jgi:hypothetical protein